MFNRGQTQRENSQIGQEHYEGKVNHVIFRFIQNNTLKLTKKKKTIPFNVYDKEEISLLCLFYSSFSFELNIVGIVKTKSSLSCSFTI